MTACVCQRTPGPFSCFPFLHSPPSILGYVPIIPRSTFWPSTSLSSVTLTPLSEEDATMCLPGSLRDNRRPSIRQETFGWHDSNGGMAHGSMPIVSPEFKQPSTVDPILPPPKGGIKDCDDLPSGKNAQHRQTSTAETSPARHSLSFDTSSERRRTGAFNTNTTSDAATAASTYVSALRQLHKRWPATAMYFLCHIAFCVAYSLSSGSLTWPTRICTALSGWTDPIQFFHHGRHHQGSIRGGTEPLNQYNRQSTGTSINSWAPTDADPPTLSDSHAAPFTSWQKIVRFKMCEPRRIVNLPGFSGKPPSSLSEQCDMIRLERRKKEGLDWAVVKLIKTASTKKPNSRERSRGRWFPAVPSGSSTRPRQRRHWLGVPSSAILARWQAPLKFHCFILRHPTPVAPCALRACASRTGIHVGVHGLSPVSAPCALGPSDFTRPSAPATTQLSAALAHLPGESPCGGVGTSRSGTAFFSPGCLREAKTLGLEARRNPSATSKSPKWHRWLVIFFITLRVPRTIDVGMALLELDTRKNKIKDCIREQT
ncbi:uncharacterized protein CLUP02_12324 [Colletotrichum lupini]|uniref:Uncharacterized protein n=1 Tax=Colletotrichum lupini TaxID=145971 RepID=A0A9Q8T211_9PEZI|nr:uncharacterized protein CLUP02_12324 [Colletotrichum lupini]UQC86822.1 hypothetical protein CLUP02_12324 [Colletotrichum lupini]